MGRYTSRNVLYGDVNYYSIMIIICRISMFTVNHIVKNEVFSFININTCSFHKILSIMYGGVQQSHNNK